MRHRPLCVLALAAVALLAAPSAAQAQQVCDEGFNFNGDVSTKPEVRRLDFGIFPGGSAGQVGPVGAGGKPEVQSKIDAALAMLRPARGRFVVHLYGHFTSPAATAAEQTADAKEIAHYTGLGYEVEYVLRYKPANEDAGSVPAYVRLVREVVARHGANPRFRALQVTNEANFTGSADTSDGAFAGARDALVQGVVAAKEEAQRRRYGQLEVGFNWFYRMPDNVEYDFWGALRDKGGKPFVAAVDWVGVDAYPGTFFPPTSSTVSKREALVNAFEMLRDCFLPVPGIPDTVPLHVGENGWPTSPPGRSYADQEKALEEMVNAVHDARGPYNVTDYRWFDLRDADSSSPNFQQQYGLTRDDYSPKPAFGTYRRLVGELRREALLRLPKARLGLRVRYHVGRTAEGRPCARRNVRGRLVGPDAGALARADFYLDGDRIARDGRRPFAHTYPESRLGDGRRHRITGKAQLRDGRRRVLSRVVSAC